MRIHRKTTRLKQLIQSPELSFLMEAHSGLSAKIAEQAGFEGIWASGLSISAMLGLRDNNEASWTQVLEVAEFMSDATGVPILLDGDTGYGNFNSEGRLVRKLEQRGIAGVGLIAERRCRIFCRQRWSSLNAAHAANNSYSKCCGSPSLVFRG